MANDTIPEEWLPINGFPGYEISDCGRVRSAPRTKLTVDGILRSYAGYILKQAHAGTKDRWYLAVSLGRNNQRLVHILVCEAFHGPRPSEEHQAAHWDGDRYNNRKGNLRWATPTENMADQIRHGTIARGSRAGNSILVEDDVLRIRERLAQGATLECAAREFGVSISTIWYIKKRGTWAWL